MVFKTSFLLTIINLVIEYLYGDFMTEREYKEKLKNKLIEYRNSLNLPSDVTFGIEIEYENINTNDVSELLNKEKLENNHCFGWQNKAEIDILEYDKNEEKMNGEIISPILKDRNRTWNNIETILDILNNNGGIVTEKCGAHVNIGAHILGTKVKHWKNFLLLWMLYEKEIYQFSSGEFIKVRADINKILERISLELNIDDITKLRRKMNLKNLDDSIFSKCSDIRITKNFNKNISINNVIEFRIPNGTLNKEIWQNYINFFARFVLACRKDLDIEKMSYKFSHNDHNIMDLANLIFKEEIDKEYFLIQALKTNHQYKKQLIKHKIYY